MICYESLFSDKDKQAFEAWHAHDDAEENFCELDGEQCTRSTLILYFSPCIKSQECPTSIFSQQY